MGNVDVSRSVIFRRRGGLKSDHPLAHTRVALLRLPFIGRVGEDSAHLSTLSFIVIATVALCIIQALHYHSLSDWPATSKSELRREHVAENGARTRATRLGKLTISQQVGHSSPLHHEGNLRIVLQCDTCDLAAARRSSQRRHEGVAEVSARNLIYHSF